MSSKSALKKKSRASLGEDAGKRKSDGDNPEIENLENVQIVKQKKKKGESVSEAPLAEHADNVAKGQDKKDKAVRSMSVAAGTDLQAKYDRLKARFDELKALRTTEAEALLEQQKENMQAKEKASAALIAALKQEKEQLATLIDHTAEAHVAELEAKLAFYENVSGVSIKTINDKKRQFACTYTARGEKPLTLDFELVTNEDGKVEYTPKSDFTSSHKLASLPEYIREEIVFDAQELPVFLSKMQNHMYKSAA